VGGRGREETGCDRAEEAKVIDIRDEGSLSSDGSEPSFEEKNVDGVEVLRLQQLQENHREQLGPDGNPN
jgi:hypothetical protein